MSEKKISALEVTNPCIGCNIAGLDSEICEDCEILFDYERLPTREQAIEKMAKAMLSFMFPRYYSWATLEEDDKKYFRKSAEAALNALLEGQNDER